AVHGEVDLTDRCIRLYLNIHLGASQSRRRNASTKSGHAENDAGTGRREGNTRSDVLATDRQYPIDSASHPNSKSRPRQIQTGAAFWKRVNVCCRAAAGTHSDRLSISLCRNVPKIRGSKIRSCVGVESAADVVFCYG